MWSKNSGIMDPFLVYGRAGGERPRQRRRNYFFGRKVLDIRREIGRLRPHHAQGEYRTRWVVNAAGLGASKISDLLGLTGYRVVGSRSNYIILHKRMGALLPMPVYPVPSNTYMGIHVTPTVDGNVTIGPDAENTDVLDDYGVPQQTSTRSPSRARSCGRTSTKRTRIRTFAGIQPKWVDENGAIQDWKVEIRDDIAPAGGQPRRHRVAGPDRLDAAGAVRHVHDARARSRSPRTRISTRTTRASSASPHVRRRSRRSSSSPTRTTAN